MTVIAYDGKTLAADRLMTVSGLKVRVRKIFRIRGHLVGSCGDVDRGNDLIEWFRAGGIRGDYPRYDKDDGASLLVVAPDGEILEYDKSPNPMKIYEKFYAIGSGKACAMSAMACGADAKKAVSIANRYDGRCGLGCDSLEFK